MWRYGKQKQEINRMPVSAYGLQSQSEFTCRCNDKEKNVEMR